MLRKVGLPWTVCRKLFLSQFGEGVLVDLFLAIWQRHFGLIAETRLTVKPGAIALLDVLDMLRLPRTIASSSSHRMVEHHLSTYGPLARFDSTVGHGDYTAGKTAPDPFLKAAERLGVTPTHCLAPEDSRHGVRSAAAVGMMIVMVPDLLDPTDEIRACCHSVVSDLHAVRHMLLGNL